VTDGVAPAAAVAEAAARLRAARRLVVFTGAGVSAESGVPTFRGAGGLWRSFRPEELATPEAFARDPRTVWEWYAWRRDLVRRCAPNAAHAAIARHGARACVDRRRLGVIADAERRRGSTAAAAADEAAPLGASAAPSVLALHGSLFATRCARCACSAGARRGRPVAGTALDTRPRVAAALPRCGALLRPGVVWFGEPLDPAVLDAAFAAAAAADACLVVGTSALVHAGGGHRHDGRRAGAALVEVNAEATPLSAHGRPASLRGAGGVARAPAARGR
jgi:NAD-dependent deacetylase